MASIAKGCFPGRPRKKIEKKKGKFSPSLYKRELEDLKWTCSFMTNITQQFHVIFNDTSDDDAHFIGFRSKSKKLHSGKKSDIGKADASEHSAQVQLQQAGIAHDSPPFKSDSASPSKNNTLLSNETDLSGGSSDSAFLKYKDSKLDFHRLSRKARNKVYEGYSAEEQAKRKDTSVASLKYASDIYLAKDHGTIGKSPIKPATFIPPTLSKHMHVAALGGTTLVIKKGAKDSSSGRKHFADQRLKQIQNSGLHETTKATKQKVSRSFVLPTKSARSSRIIKANRKYIDSDSEPSGMINLSQASAVPSSTSVSPIECSVRVPRIPVRQDMEIENMKLLRQMEEDATKLARRKPLIKEPTFQVVPNLFKARLYHRHKDGAHARAQRLIKRAKFKHSDISLQALSVENQRKKIIRDATFTAPLTNADDSEKVSHSPHRRKKSSSSDEVSDLGLPSSTWCQLTDPVELGKSNGTSLHKWSMQEIHNILHGAHTFGASWASVARQYDFHETHRDWLSVRKKGSKCRTIGLLNSSYKVKSSILLQLKPKISDNPNVTVFTPLELQQRQMTNNITCNLESRMKAGELGLWNYPDEKAVKKRRRKSNKRSDSSSSEDLYLGLTRQRFHKIMHTKSEKTRKWEVWEIHNLLHGVHWFGAGEWMRIHNMYKFKGGHDNMAIRSKFRTFRSLQMVVEGQVRGDVVSKLRPSLSVNGAEYFQSKGIKVTQYRSKKKRDMQDVTNTTKHGRRHQVSKQHRRGAKIKQPTMDDSDDSTTISPPRKQAYHLFGTVPVWDEASQSELMGMKANDTSTPVMRALEDGLRKNSSSSNDDFPTSSLLRGTPSSPLKSDTSQLTSPGGDKSHKAERKGGGTNSRRESSEANAAKAPGKGPRIKHVCRRASLVTGQVKATYDDVTPQLSALPKDERDKIAAEAEKLKEHPPQFSSSDNDEDGKLPHKTVNPTMVPRREKAQPARKRSGVALPCGKCESCVAPPCGECEACRSHPEGGSEEQAVPCTRRKACLHHDGGQAKRSKRSEQQHQHGSRKSSRLQQQKVPLLSSTAGDQSASRDHMGVSTSVKLSTVGHKTTNANQSTFRSPSSLSTFPDVFSPIKQAIVKLDNWKETYDLEQLWKTGGHSLITSNPSAPRIVCFLCGSFGSRDQVENRIVHCACCCEPFHVCCADEKHDQPRVLSAMANGTWVCRRCRYCHVCGQTRNLLECRHCRKTYHSECLGPSYPTKESESGVWVCMRCVRCQSCGASKPGNLTGAEWTHDFTMCQRCGDLFDKGNYCPICQRCYSDEDFETRMVQCAGCKRWVHSKCESLSVEMYTLLSHLPDNVQYKCPDCDNRGGKLKKILEEEEEEEVKNFTENSKGNSPDAEKIRRILSQLPAPPWRTIIEKEVQTGLEEITMALFHNHAMYCTLKKKEISSEGASPAYASPKPDYDVTKPHDLFAVRFAVHNRRYKSLNDFYADVREILVSVPDEEDRRAVMVAFKEEAGKVFPWFNFETGRIRDVDDVPENLLPHATMPPIPEHDYAQWLDKDITLTPGTPMSQGGNCTPAKSELWNSPSKDAEDLRQCIFCNKYGDDKPMNGGRLLYCGQDEWSHVNCALWSAEVFEQHDGSLQNVHSAASRGKMMKCDFCRTPGATVGCHTRDCPKNYHFMCARKAGCFFQLDKKVYCARHPQHVKQEVMHGQDFEVHRLVCVDNEEMRPNRRWQRGMHAASITVTIGALTVHQLGKLALASDTRDCLIPVSYRVTRVFWSTVSANRKTVYTVTVTDRKPSLDSSEHDKSSGNNMTISHSAEPSDKPPEAPRHASPTIPCKTKLVERLGQSSNNIGPLSPTRRPSRPEGGTYTIVSSINRTLPQLVTPIPAPAKTTAPKPTDKPTVDEVISKDNPFFNPNAALRPVADKQAIPPVFVPVLTACEPVLGGVVGLPQAKTKSSEDASLKLSPTTSTVIAANQKSMTSPHSRAEAFGSSGSTMSSAKHLKPPENVVERPESCSGVIDNIAQTTTDSIAVTTSSTPDFTQNIKENTPVAPKQLIDDSALGKENSVHPIDKEPNESLKGNGETPVTISLLVKARKATQVEKTETAQPARLWWQKHADASSHPSDVTGSKRSNSADGITPPRRLRSSFRSADNDPEFVANVEAIWKRLPGESVKEATSRVVRQPRDRSCKMKQKSDQEEVKPVTPHVEESDKPTVDAASSVVSEIKDNEAVDEIKKENDVGKGTECKLRESEEEPEKAKKVESVEPEEQTDETKSKTASASVCPKVEDVDSEDESPTRDKTISLRRFTRSTAKSEPKSPAQPRERSKSHNPLTLPSTNLTVKESDSSEFKAPMATRMRTRHSSTEKPAQHSPSKPPTTSENVPQTATESPPRRYPRRDSFTCLKSFSGLSPSYALASYSRAQSKTESGKKLRKRLSSPCVKKPPKPAASKKSTPKISRKKSTPRKDDKNVDDVSHGNSDDVSETKESEVLEKDAEQGEGIEASTQLHVPGPQNNFQVVKEVQVILQDILKSVDEFYLKRSYEPEQTDRAKSIDDHQQSNPVTSNLDDSVEIARSGGSDEEKGFPSGDIPDTSLVADSADLGDSVNCPNTRRASVDLSTPKSLLASEVIDIPDQLSLPSVETLTNDLMSTSECPVLNADEVETLLESPEPMQRTLNESFGQCVFTQDQQFCALPSAPFQTQPTAEEQQYRAPIQPIPVSTYQIDPNAGNYMNSSPYQAPPPIKRTPLCSANPNPAPTGPLSYSLRVTMAMAGALRDSILTSSAFGPSHGQTYAQSGIEKPTQPMGGNISINHRVDSHGSGTYQEQNTLQQQSSTLYPQQEQTQPTPSRNEINALEQMINYYSAKNNLTPEEKEIVRSIINTQIQTNQLPLPSRYVAPKTKPGEATTKKNAKNEKTAKPKKRKTSLEKEKFDPTSKVKRKRKESKRSFHSSEIDAPWSVHPDDSSSDSSLLMDVYAKRHSLFKTHKLPFLKVLSTYNIFLGDKKTNRENRLPPPPVGGSPSSKHLPYLIYEIKSDDGYYASGPDLQELINHLHTSVQECRSTAKGGNPCLALSSVMTPHKFLGLSHDAIRFLVEQLPGARHCHKYRAKYHKHKKSKDEVTHINPHGCCRAEKYKGRSKPDMFSFLASKYRIPPEFMPDRSQDDDMLQFSNRRATSMEQLPMAMRFRHLRTFAREAVGVYRSSIHGRGLYCKRDVEAGEMVMEYTGEVIRRELTDKREKYYESKSIGCYMFRMDDFFVVDATMRGSSARFINHSCEPNCYSRIVQVEGKKHIVIFALRKIYRGEELTYDYKFPIEDENHKIACNCGSRLCRKYMN